MTCDSLLVPTIPNAVLGRIASVCVPCGTADSGEGNGNLLNTRRCRHEFVLLERCCSGGGASLSPDLVSLPLNELGRGKQARAGCVS